ncbi:MAG: sensor histidine kinase [Propionibacteriaceae bacterium]
MTDLMVIVGVSLGCCAVVGMLGLVVLRRLRGRSLGLQLGIAALMPVLAVACSVALNVQLMFLSGHDSGVIVIALLSSSVLALAAGWLVLRRISRGSAQLGSGVGLLLAEHTGSPVPAPVTPTLLPLEFEQLRHELVEARQTLAAARTRERNAERARSELVSFMSHDLRTPLAGLRALTEGLEDGVITDVPRALGQLRATVARMSGLVEDLFELSRVESPAPQVHRPVSLTELVGDVADELDAAALAAQVELRVDLPDSDRLAVSGDADALVRALANLVSNAIRHTAVGGRVEISALRAADGRIRVGVADGCGGIPEPHLDRVFDTGWRGTSARTPERTGEPTGAGLGLAITKGVVRAHDGSIEVRNVTGGCRFELELPAGGMGSNLPVGSDRAQPETEGAA